MLIDDGKYFLYRHIRCDNNEVFYIGIGTKYYGKNTFNEMYRRAFLKAQRNLYWKRIINNTEYIVEIICESDSYNYIIEKEKEFISLYGRRDLNKGTLCNFTDGGEGQSGVIRKKMTEETKNKISIANKNKPKSEDHKKALSVAKLKSPNKYWKGKSFSEDHKEKLKKPKIKKPDAKPKIVSDETKAKLKEVYRKKFENYNYPRTNRKHYIKYTKDEIEKIYKETAIKNTGSGNRKAKQYKIKYNNEIYVEFTTLNQISIKYNITLWMAMKILKKKY